MGELVFTPLVARDWYSVFVTGMSVGSARLGAPRRASTGPFQHCRLPVRRVQLADSRHCGQACSPAWQPTVMLRSGTTTILVPMVVYDAIVAQLQSILPMPAAFYKGNTCANISDAALALLPTLTVRCGC